MSEQDHLIKDTPVSTMDASNLNTTSLNDVAGYSPEDEVDWIIRNAKKKEGWIPIIVGPCVVV